MRMPIVRAGKMHAREANRLALVHTMLRLLVVILRRHGCNGSGLSGLMATLPTLPAPRDVERIADGCANHVVTHWLMQCSGIAANGRRVIAGLLFPRWAGLMKYPRAAVAAGGLQTRLIEQLKSIARASTAHAARRAELEALWALRVLVMRCCLGRG